jgi:hypothetical protein
MTHPPKLSLNLETHTLYRSTSHIIKSIRTHTFKVPDYFSPTHNHINAVSSRNDLTQKQLTRSRQPLSSRFCELPPLSIHRNPDSCYSPKELKHIYSKPLKLALKRRLGACYYPKSLRYVKPDWNRVENDLKKEGEKFYHLTDEGTMKSYR